MATALDSLAMDSNVDMARPVEARSSGLRAIAWYASRASRERGMSPPGSTSIWVARLALLAPVTASPAGMVRATLTPSPTLPAAITGSR
jgi:hypothetical protein